MFSISKDESSIGPTLIVGDGRLAKHLLFLNELRLSDTRRTSPSGLGSTTLPITPSRWLQWRRELGLEDLQTKVRMAHSILILIRDSEIEDFYRAHICDQVKPDTIVGHASGALVVQGLVDIHPLMTFGPDLYPRGAYDTIPVVTSSDKVLALEFLKRLGLDLWENNLHTISARQKALYHTYCVMTGNFPVILWQNMVLAFSDLGLPKEIINPYIQQTVQNFSRSPDTGLTGPLVRNDFPTIEKHFEALMQFQPKFVNLYRDFVDLYKRKPTGVESFSQGESGQ